MSGAELQSALGTVCNTVPTSLRWEEGAVSGNGLRFAERRVGGCSAALPQRSLSEGQRRFRAGGGRSGAHTSPTLQRQLHRAGRCGVSPLEGEGPHAVGPGESLSPPKIATTQIPHTSA